MVRSRHDGTLEALLSLQYADSTANEPLVISSLLALARLKGADAASAITPLTTPKKPMAAQTAAVEATILFDTKQAARTRLESSYVKPFLNTAERRGDDCERF